MTNAYDARIGRRRFLQGSALAAGAGLAGGNIASAAADPGTGDAHVFRHSVGSGDPLPDGVVLWTRVTPTAAATPGSGWGPDCSVLWEMSSDKDFHDLVACGVAAASAARDHTVKVDVRGLAPATGYFFRFRVLDGPAEGARSRVGRTRTAPAANADVERLRFAVCSCSNWEAGYFEAYRHMAAREDLDAVLHLGDSIYEYGRGGYTGKSGAVRDHEPAHEVATLSDYRIRMGQYATDPDLADLRARVPFIVTWDDHESADNAHRDGAENHQPGEGDWQMRRAASAQAYFEWMPTRPQSLDGGGHLYRALRFGNLAELRMLDLRTYRDQQADAPGGWPHLDDPDRTMTGAAQFDWLVEGLTTSSARWKVVGTSVMITPVLIPPLDPRVTEAVTKMAGLPRDGVPYNTDQWDGYPAERRRLFDQLLGADVENVVFLTGDIHSSWAAEVPVVPGAYRTGGAVVGTEFVAPSITASNIDDMLSLPEGNPVSLAAAEALKLANPHVKALDLDRHGYLLFEITAEQVRADYWFVGEKTAPASGLTAGMSLRTPAGSPVVQQA